MAEEKTSTQQKAVMTDEERLALCSKLDGELDDFINSLERKKYSDGWSEETWEDEMDKHPFFMKQVSDDGQMSPLAEGLANMKYDPAENTAHELANNYREDGNFNFKHKNYRMAILGYTEGIRVKCEDPEVNASLYNNRAAAHWQLKNYRSTLADCAKALNVNPAHEKARKRAAQAALQLSKYDTCIEHCQKYLEGHTGDNEMTELLKKAKDKQLIQNRDKRKRERNEIKANKEKEELVKTICLRGIKISNHDEEDELDLAKLEPCLPGASEAIVHLENNVLMWPILLLYPEHQMTDFIQNCPEDCPLVNQLEQVFPAPWDSSGKYSCGSVNVYFEGGDKKAWKVDPAKKLGDLLVQRNFLLRAGTPAFFVVVRGSKVEKQFLEKY